MQPGLGELALPYKKNKELREIVAAVGRKYLGKGITLLHGDYYPGSWMSSRNKVYVIDPEFSFIGFPEFDLGVMAAHAIAEVKVWAAAQAAVQGSAATIAVVDRVGNVLAVFVMSPGYP